MPYMIGNRYIVALHAAARAVLLLDTFRQAAQWTGAEAEIAIERLPDEDLYTTEVKLHVHRDYYTAPSGHDATREDIVRAAAECVITDAAEDVVCGLSDRDRATALDVAARVAEHHARASYVFRPRPGEIDAIAQEALAFGADLLREHSREFNNLARVFINHDRLCSRKEIEIVSWTGLAPLPQPPAP